MDRISPEKRSWNMSRIKSKDTTPERIERSFLHRNGFRFRLHVKDLPGTPDIVLPKYKTVIEVCNAPRLSREALRGSGQKMKES